MITLQKPSKKLLIWSIIVFLFALFLRLHYIDLKQGFHCDELYSINISNVNEVGWSNPTLTPENKPITGKELKEQVLFNNGSVNETIKDVLSLHQNTYDEPHTNLYYSVLRIWCTGHTSNQINAIKWRCCLLNLVFFAFSFLLMFKILRRTLKDESLIPLGLLAAFCNTASLSMCLFIRPYELQTTIFLLLIYFVINFYRDIDENKLISKSNFIKASISLALTMLSGYFSIIYITLLGIILITKSIIKKQYKNITFLCLSALTALLGAWLFYFGYFIAFTGYRMQDINTAISISQIIRNSFSGFISAYKNFLFYSPCLLFLIIALIRNIFHQRKEQKSMFAENKTTWIFIGASLLWTVIIMLIAPFKVLRYIAPVFPILAILYPLIIANLNNIEKRIYTVIFSTIIVIFSIIPAPIESADARYPQVKESKNGPRIENLFITQKAVYPYALHPEIPVYIITYGNLLLQELSPLFADEQEINIYKEGVLPFHENSFYLIVESEDDKFLNQPIITQYFKAEPLSNIQRYITTAKLTRK